MAAPFLVQAVTMGEHERQFQSANTTALGSAIAEGTNDQHSHGIKTHCLMGKMESWKPQMIELWFNVFFDSQEPKNQKID